VSRVRTCPTCGEKIQAGGECLYCAPPAAPEPSPAAPEPALVAAPPPPPPAAAPPAGPSAADRALGLTLFEAEEALARGQSDKAVVLASRAVRERPDSITARALYERAHRDFLRGRRREKLESRIEEARGLLEGGDLHAAERIVTSALKLLPDHAVALKLLTQLRERRHAPGSVEAEAERELAQHEAAQARRSLEAARSALAARSPGRALLGVRRALRRAPGDPELLAFLRELQQSEAGREQETARRRALAAQTRAGLELLALGRLEESRTMLRAVLREDPDHARAQAAIQDLRRAWLQRAGEPLPGPAAGPVKEPLSRRPPLSAPPAAVVSAPVSRTPRPPLARPPAPRGIPSEIVRRQARRRATPLVVILGVAGLVAAVVYFATRAPRSSTAPAALRSGPATPAPAASATPEPPGPLSRLDPGLRRVVEETLARYARALESQDGDLFAQARPDLSAQERSAQIAELAGALNVGIDLRVLDVVVEGDRATVPILRTDVVVGGRASPRPPFEEVLVFERRADGWALRPRA
jgi:tetratricopeptide (TPR) repeat protein